MIGKKVIVVANLKPAMLRGVESQGMILAGSKKKLLEVISVENLPNGTKIHYSGIFPLFSILNKINNITIKVSVAHFLNKER